MKPTALILTLALVLLGGPAAAEVFVGKGGFVHFCLSRGTVCSPEDADLHVSAHGVWAQAGLRRASRGNQFQQLEVTTLDEPYDLRDPLGGRWRMAIRSAGAGLEVDLVRAQPPGPPPIQVFRAVAVTIRGAWAAPTFSPLTLFPNGQYQLGGAHGRYIRDDFGVTLDGAPSMWGKASYLLEADGLVFRFSRGPLMYEVRYQLVVPSVS